MKKLLSLVATLSMLASIVSAPGFAVNTDGDGGASSAPQTSESAPAGDSVSGSKSDAPAASEPSSSTPSGSTGPM